MNKIITFIIFLFAVYILQREIDDTNTSNFVDTISCKQKEDTSFFDWEFYNSHLKDTLSCIASTKVFIDTNSNKIDSFQVYRIAILSPYRKSYSKNDVYSLEPHLEQSDIVFAKGIFKLINKEIHSLNDREFEYINTNRPMDYEDVFLFNTRFKVYPLE
jgi:hypothetical protein